MRHRRVRAQLIEPVQAQIIRTPLHVGGAEPHAERRQQRGQVLEVDLLLQVLGAGRDQHPLPIENRRHQVGERLAGAGPGLGEQHAAMLQRVRHRGGHGALTLARFEVIDGARQRSVIGKRGLDRGA